MRDESTPAKCKMCGKETREPTKMDGDCLYCPACVFGRAEMLRHDLDVIYEVIRDRLGIECVQGIKDAVDNHYQAASGRLPGRCRDCNEPGGKLTCDMCGGEVIESTTNNKQTPCAYLDIDEERIRSQLATSTEAMTCLWEWATTVACRSEAGDRYVAIAESVIRESRALMRALR